MWYLLGAAALIITLVVMDNRATAAMAAQQTVQNISIGPGIPIVTAIVGDTLSLTGVGAQATVSAPPGMLSSIAAGPNSTVWDWGVTGPGTATISWNAGSTTLPSGQLFNWSAGSTTVTVAAAPGAPAAPVAPLAPVAPVTPAVPAIPASGQTMTVPVVPGNIGVIVLPYGATALLMMPSGASLTNGMSGVSAAPPNLLNVAPNSAIMGGAPVSGLAITTTSAFTATSQASMTLNWTDAGGTAQQSTVQIVPEAQSTSIYLTPQNGSSGTLPNVYLPVTGGEILFMGPSGNGTVNSATLAPGGSGFNGTVYPANAAANSPSSYGAVATGPGTGAVSIVWTDASGNQWTNTVTISTLSS